MSWMPEGNPQPGDLIEIFWPACQHWAIYVGYGCVVHLVPEGNHSGSDTSGLGSFGIHAFGSYGTSSLGSIMHDYAEVKMEPLWKVADNGYQINNKYDAKYKRRPVGEIVAKAKAAVGTKMPYNLLNHNCEHFVTNLRYGIPVSDQVKPQPGDLIEISRTGCQHWAIYVGNGDVVHLVPEGNLSGSDISSLGSSGISGLGSVIFDYAVVKRETLWKVAGNDYRINNKYDARHKRRPVNEIISEAKATVGKKMPFNSLNGNCEDFVTGLRYGIHVSDQVKPQPGDLIEISRTGCQHWAIYVGNEEVVHLVPEGNLLGSDISRLGSSGITGLGSVMHDHAEVKMEPLWKVVDNGYQINNKYDAKYKHRPGDVIVSKAKAAVGAKMPYNLLNHNCEHFATNLRYGIPLSDQADSKKSSVTTVCAAICTAAFFANPIGTVAVAGGALLLREFWRRRQHEHE